MTASRPTRRAGGGGRSPGPARRARRQDVVRPLRRRAGEEDDQHARGADGEGDERGVRAAGAPAPHERRSERPEEDTPHAEGPGERLEVEVDVAAAVEAGGRGEAKE